MNEDHIYIYFIVSNSATPFLSVIPKKNLYMNAHSIIIRNSQMWRSKYQLTNRLKQIIYPYRVFGQKKMKY
jgi:hypothetical protein